MKKEVRKRSKRSKKYRDTQREKGNSKILGNSPWAPKMATQRFEKSVDVCCKYGDKKERERARGSPK